MPVRGGLERIALFVLLPLLALVCLATWRLWQHVDTLDAALTQSKKAELELLVRVRDAVGREDLAGRALGRALQELNTARSGEEQARLDADAAQEEAARQSAVAERLKRQRLAELDRMKDALSLIAETDRTPVGMVVMLSEESFLFEFDSAELSPRNREILSRIAGVLLASYGYRISIYGYTDDQGNAAYNQRLSERRAQAVRDYLLSAGVREEILSHEGFGETSPRQPGRSREARRKNRRVEIGIVDTIIEYGGQVTGAGG